MTKSTRFTIAVVIVALGIVLMVRAFHSPTPPVANSSSDDPAADEAAMAEPVATPSPTPSESPSPTTSPSVVVDPAVVQQKFAGEVAEFGKCFEVNTAATDKLEPTFENLANAIRNDMGDVVTANEDWSMTNLELPSGEHRRIRIEVDYSGEDPTVRKLSYFSVSKEGLASPIPLEKEQTENPSDTFIAGLEGDGKVLSREKGVRAYYSNGEEFLYTEKNGRMTDLEITKSDGTRFKCTNLDNNESTCRCM